MEKGPLLVLMQPSEFLIIAGAALGTLLSGNPLYVLKKVAGGLVAVLKGPRYSKQRYIDLLKMMYTFSTRREKRDWPASKAISKSRRRARCSRSIRNS